MKLFVIIATIVACASAAPTAELQHPSPVNPNVLVEIKPQEKIVLITDPRELAKFKRETKQPLYPTVLPGDQLYYRTKRDVTQKPQEFQNPQLLPANLPVEEVITEKYSEPKSNHQIEIQNTNNDNRKKSQEDQENVEKNVTTEVYQKPQGLPAIFSPSNKAIQQQKRDIPVPLVAKHQHPEESPKEPNEKVTQQEKHDDQKVSEVFQKPQGLPAIFSPANGAAAVQPQKRDIPVPLVPKYHHPEESPKELDNKESQAENKKELDNEKKHEAQTSPLKEDHVIVEGFQKPQTLPLILKDNHDETQHKRDIPVPLVPKYHHPEESPKESNEKEDHEEKKEVETEYHQIGHANNHEDHVAKLPLILKENSAETQHKRDIPVPLVPKYHHPEESPKESNENKKEIDSENHHVVVAQPLPAHNEDHVIAEGFQKPQTLPLILKDNHDDDTQHKRDIPVPLVPKYQHPEESPKESNEKEDHEEKKEVKTENHQGPQIVHANNHEDHVTKLPLILKENSEETQHKRDIPVPLVPKYHHPEESPKESNENKKEIDSENHHVVAQTLPAHNEDHVTAEGFQKPQTLPLILKDNHDDDTQHKRDIPVPLVPKYQHPEESPKESNKKEDHEEKKEVETDNHQEPHQAHGNKHEDHVAKLPLILKANSAETQHKRDIPVPLVPKYDHPEESPKDINDKEDHQDRKENNNVPAHNQDHVNAEGYQKPQTLPLSLKEASENHHHVEEAPKENNEKKSHDEDKNETNLENSQHHVSHIHHVTQTLPNHHHHEHVSFEAIHRPQVNHEHSSSNKHQEQTTQKDEEKIVDDAKTHHIQSQTLNGNIHHKHLAMEGLQKPQILPSHNNQEHIISTAALSHLPTHFSAEDLKQTHNSATVMGHQHEANKNEGDHHPNRHEVQVEDLSDSKPFQQPIYNHAQPAVGDHKPNILDDHLSAHDFTTSTTTTTVPNILRHRPVPVAELFARAHGN